jgi:hypothetical protein
MDDRKFNSLEDAFMTALLFSTIVMLIIKWEWYLDIPYWVVFAPIYVPIIVVALVIAILSIIEPKQNKK